MPLIFFFGAERYFDGYLQTPNPNRKHEYVTTRIEEIDICVTIDFFNAKKSIMV